MNQFSRTIIDQMLCDASKYTASMLRAEMVYGVELYAMAFANLREAIGLIKAERKRIDERYAQGGITREEYDARSHRNFDLLCWAADCKKAADDLMYEHFEKCRCT